MFWDRCVKFRQTVIPFQMNVEQVYLLAGFYEESMPGSYGRVYSGSDERLMNYNRFQVHGGMFVRSDSTTNNKNGQCGSLDSYPSSSSYSLVSCSALLERSFKEQLLSKYASNAYLSHKAMQIPYIFAAASELLVSALYSSYLLLQALPSFFSSVFSYRSLWCSASWPLRSSIKMITCWWFGHLPKKKNRTTTMMTVNLMKKQNTEQLLFVMILCCRPLKQVMVPLSWWWWRIQARCRHPSQVNVFFSESEIFIFL